MRVPDGPGSELGPPAAATGQVTAGTVAREPSVNRRILRAIVVVGFFMGVFALASFVQDVVVARRFGAGSTVDAFVLALVVPTFVAAIVSDAFTTAFLPVYVEIGESDGPAASRRVFGSTVAIATAVLVALTLALAVVAPLGLPALTAGFDRDAAALARSLFYILLPIVPLSGVAALWRATLNAGERFGNAALSRTAVPLTAVATVLAVDGIRALAVGTVLGYGLQLVVLARSLRTGGLPVVPRSWHLDAAVRRVIAQCKPMAWGALIMGGAPFVDWAMASRLEEGSVAALHYANRVPMVIIGIGGAAVGTAVFPYFSRLVATRKWATVRRTFRTFAVVVAAITVPLTAALALGSEPLVRLLFERGAFDSGDTSTVAPVQALLVLQLPFFLMGTLLTRLVSACKANEILMWGAIFSFVLNVALNLVLMEWFDVAGIALSTSLVYLFSSVYISVRLVRLLRERRVDD